jgi:hypothetical protein
MNDKPIKQKEEVGCYWIHFVSTFRAPMRSPSLAALSVISTSLCAQFSGIVLLVRTPCTFTASSCCINDQHASVFKVPSYCIRNQQPHVFVSVVRTSYMFTVSSCCINDQHASVFTVPSCCIRNQQPHVFVSVLRTSYMFTVPSCCINDQHASVFTVPSYIEGTIWTIHCRSREPAFPFNKCTQPLLRSVISFVFPFSISSGEINKRSFLVSHVVSNAWFAAAAAQSGGRSQRQVIERQECK